MSCVLIVLMICHRWRHIHPAHIALIFGRSREQTDEFVIKLIMRGILQVDYLPELDRGMTIGKCGSYLLRPKRSKKYAILNEIGYHNEYAKVKRRVSRKTLHDQISLLIALQTADKLHAVDLIPDFSSGFNLSASPKIPDVFLKTYDQRIHWIEVECSPKWGEPLHRFCNNLLRSLDEGKADYVWIFLNRESDAKRYRKTLENSYVDNKHRLLEQIRIVQNTSVRHFGALEGEVPGKEFLTREHFCNGHIPDAWHLTRCRPSHKDENQLKKPLRPGDFVYF